MFKVGDKVSISLDRKILPNYLIPDGTVGVVTDKDETTIIYPRAYGVLVEDIIYRLYSHELTKEVIEFPNWEI